MSVSPRTARDPLAEFERALACLRPEVPGAVHDDVMALWRNLRSEFALVPRGSGEPCAITWPRTPCPNCDGDPMWFGAAVNNAPPPDGDYSTCKVCGGEGWVWGTPTTHKLEQVGRYFDGEPAADLNVALFRLVGSADTAGSPPYVEVFNASAMPPTANELGRIADVMVAAVEAPVAPTEDS